MPQTQSRIPQSDNNISSSFLPVILWVKAYINENAKAWENENALFSNTSETCVIRMTFVLASDLISNIEAFKKHVLVQ